MRLYTYEELQEAIVNNLEFGREEGRKESRDRIEALEDALKFAVKIVEFEDYMSETPGEFLTLAKPLILRA